MRIAVVTNMPAPYRIPSWNEVAKLHGDNFLVIFCSHREPNRNWDIPEMKFQHVYLRENFYAKNDGTTFVHNNKDVWKHLKKFNPEIIITGGYNPTMLYAFIYAVLRRKKHIPMSDAWKMSESHLSLFHRLLRKMIFRFSHAFIACSQKGKEYYQSFGRKEESIFISHYTITNSLFRNDNTFTGRRYDLLFSGQFIERKNPYLFIEVAGLLRKKGFDIKILLLGDGPLKERMLSRLQVAGIEYSYPGNVKQQELPRYYADARLFLFPTKLDAWGVVVNESLAAGTPVLSTPYAGCAGELIIHGQNGFIAEPEAATWAECCASVLQNELKWKSYSEQAVQIASGFTHERAATALMDACRYAMK